MKHLKHHETLLIHDETLLIHDETLLKHHGTLKHSPFDVTISAIDAETSALARSLRRYWYGVSGDCGVDITPQMCNRVTNHGPMQIWALFPNLTEDEPPA